MVNVSDRRTARWLRELEPASAWNDCQCRILLSELWPDDVLPDHVCAATAHLSVLNHFERNPWLRETSGDRRLLLVIRRRVEEDPSPTRRNQLSSSPAWSEIVARYREIGRDNPGGIAWILTVDRAAIRNELRSAGLPQTNQTIAFLYESIMDGVRINGTLIDASKATPPSYGALVTVLVWSDGPQFTIGGDLDLVTGPLMEKIAKSTVQIRDRLAEIGAFHNPITETPSVRRAALRGASLDHFQPAPQREANDPYYDYEAEALQPENVAKLRRQATTHRIGSVQATSEYLERIYKRVAERRRKVGIQRSRPEDNGWRDRVRKHLANQF